MVKPTIILIYPNEKMTTKFMPFDFPSTLENYTLACSMMKNFSMSMEENPTNI